MHIVNKTTLGGDGAVTLPQFFELVKALRIVGGKLTIKKARPNFTACYL